MRYEGVDQASSMHLTLMLQSMLARELALPAGCASCRSGARMFWLSTGSDFAPGPWCGKEAAQVRQQDPHLEEHVGECESAPGRIPAAELKNSNEDETVLGAPRTVTRPLFALPCTYGGLRRRRDDPAALLDADRSL